MKAEARAWALNGLRVIVLAWLVFHFALTGIYVADTSPLSRALGSVLDAYTGRYFSQDWDLFAPDPLSANLSLMVRPLTPAEAAAAARSGAPRSGWYDLTQALWEERQRSPFSYAEALGHFHVVMIQDYLRGDPATFSSLYACREESREACASAKAWRRTARRRATIALWRLASEFVNARWPAPSPYTAMALKIREQLPTRWPDRGSGRRAVQDVWMGVYATDLTRPPSPAPAAAVRP